MGGIFLNNLVPIHYNILLLIIIVCSYFAFVFNYLELNLENITGFFLIIFIGIILDSILIYKTIKGDL